jgi:adenosine deaminase
MEDHSIKALMDAGVCVTISSDDPSYFGGYINANYIAVQEAFDLTKEDIIGLARNSFKVSFLSEEERRKAEAKLDAYCSAFAFT